MNQTKVIAALICLTLIYAIGATVLIQRMNQTFIENQEEMIRVKSEKQQLDKENELYRQLTNNI